MPNTEKLEGELIKKGIDLCRFLNLENCSIPRDVLSFHSILMKKVPDYIELVYKKGNLEYIDDLTKDEINECYKSIYEHQKIVTDTLVNIVEILNGYYTKLQNYVNDVVQIEKSLHSAVERYENDRALLVETMQMLCDEQLPFSSEEIDFIQDNFNVSYGISMSSLISSAQKLIGQLDIKSEKDTKSIEKKLLKLFEDMTKGKEALLKCKSKKAKWLGYIVSYEAGDALALQGLDPEQRKKADKILNSFNQCQLAENYGAKVRDFVLRYKLIKLIPEVLSICGFEDPGTLTETLEKHTVDVVNKTIHAKVSISACKKKIWSNI